MTIIRVRENEMFEACLRRFKRSCEKSGTQADVRRHEFYEKPTTKRKRKKLAAIKRLKKKQMREKLAMQRDRQPNGTDTRESKQH